MYAAADLAERVGGVDRSEHAVAAAAVVSVAIGDVVGEPEARVLYDGGRVAGCVPDWLDDVVLHRGDDVLMKLMKQAPPVGAEGIDEDCRLPVDVDVGARVAGVERVVDGVERLEPAGRWVV